MNILSRGYLKAGMKGLSALILYPTGGPALMSYIHGVELEDNPLSFGDGPAVMPSARGDGLAVMSNVYRMRLGRPSRRVGLCRLPLAYRHLHLLRRIVRACYEKESLRFVGLFGPSKTKIGRTRQTSFSTWGAVRPSFEDKPDIGSCALAGPLGNRIRFGFASLENPWRSRP
jgi:hypothetical protein